MKNDIKIQMKARAALCKGLLNVLKDDIEMVYKDADTCNMFMISESINESKDTLQKILDCLTEIEYIAYLTKIKD